MRAAAVYRRTVIALVCALCLSSCTSGSAGRKSKTIENKAAQREHKVIEVRETNGLSENGDIIAASSWSSGDDLEVWYRDRGPGILIATRSTGRVLIHVDVNQDGVPDSGHDRVYAFGPDPTIHAQFSRPVWATASWDGFKTLGSVETRNRAGASSFNLWRLPKEELSPLREQVELTFEIFDESYQTSQFRPGNPFEMVLRLKYSKPSGKIATGAADPPGRNGSGPLVSDLGAASKKVRSVDGPSKGTDSLSGTNMASSGARQAEEKARQEREAAREQEMDRQRQELTVIKAQQEQQQRQIEEARQKLASDQAQRENDQKARDEMRAKLSRADPAPPPVPEPTKIYRGPTSGEITWEGNIKGTELITIENGQASSGNVSGALPGVLCLLQPADSKRVSIASTPGPYNQYKRMVFRVTGNGRTRVVIKWSLP